MLIGHVIELYIKWMRVCVRDSDAGEHRLKL